jgi:flagellar biosynthesis/type III secretory pathway M-ring protein FliF/YscJ
MYNPTININWKKTIIGIIILIVLIGILFAVYNIYIVPTEEEVEQQEREILDAKIQEERSALDQAREDARGDDYVPPTTEEREADIEKQIEELQNLRRR